MTKKGTKTCNKKKKHKDMIKNLFFILKCNNTIKNSLHVSVFDHICSVSVHFYYEYLNTQATVPGSEPEPVPGPKSKRDWDRYQLSEPDMTGTLTGTNNWDQK